MTKATDDLAAIVKKAIDRWFDETSVTVDELFQEVAREAAKLGNHKGWDEGMDALSRAATYLKSDGSE